MTVPEGEGALGGGANNTAHYLGSAVGVTVVAGIAPAGDGTGVQGLVDGWNHAALVTVVGPWSVGWSPWCSANPAVRAPAHTDEKAGMRVAAVPE